MFGAAKCRIWTYQAKTDHEIKLTEAAVRGDRDGGGDGGAARVPNP
jgi:hypothetical protein